MFNSDFYKVWKNLLPSKTITSYHIIQYAILKAMDKYKDDPAIVTKATGFVYYKMAKAFTPVRRKSKLDNGRQEFDAVQLALGHLNYSPNIFFQDEKNILTKTGRSIYRDIIRQLSIKALAEYYKREYVYIFVRQDISPEYQAVQSAHVALRLGYKLGYHSEEHKMTHDRMKELYFTLVGVPNLDALTKISERQGAELFHEPDINNQLTAVAYMPVKAKDRGKLLTYKRLVFNPPQRTDAEIWDAQKSIINRNAP